VRRLGECAPSRDTTLDSLYCSTVFQPLPGTLDRTPRGCLGGESHEDEGFQSSRESFMIVKSNVRSQSLATSFVGTSNKSMSQSV